MRSAVWTKLAPAIKGVRIRTFPLTAITTTTSSGLPIAATACRNFSAGLRLRARNQVYTPVRHPDDLHTYQLLSASAGRPLATLWTASWCAACRAAEPVVRSVAEGEQEGAGLAFCVVEFDAPDVMAAGLGATYMISSLPTLLCFDERGEPRAREKVTDPAKLGDRAFLEEWFRAAARRGGSGGLF